MPRPENLPLQPDDKRRRNNEHRCEYRTRADRVKAAAALMDALVNERRDIVDAVLDAEHRHRSEMRHRVEHDKECARENTRQHQRDRDLARDRKEPRPRDAR